MKYLLLMAVLLTHLISAAQADSLEAKLQAGEECTVKFDTFYKDGSEVDCLGTIARGMTYSIQYDLDNGKWTGTGYVCNAGKNQKHTDAGPSPTDGYIGLWGMKFKYKSDGAVLDKDEKKIGKVTC